MTTVRALVVNAGPSLELLDVNPSLDSLQGAVDGYIEVLVGNGPWHAYVNKKGAFRPDCPPNPAATAIARHLGWRGQAYGGTLAGTCLFFGTGGEDPADVPQLVLDAAAELGYKVRT